MHQNLLDMQLELFNDFALVSKGTVGDGNCGVEMLVGFFEGDRVPDFDGRVAEREDMLSIFNQYRIELADMWRSVSEVSCWQKVWKYFVAGRIDMTRWKMAIDLPSIPPATPSPKKCDLEGAVTPEKDRDRQTKRGKLLADGEVPLDEVDIGSIVQTDTSEPPLKKKKTGKPRDPELVFTFERYYRKAMSERGITYRNWTNIHKRDVRLVFLDRTF